MPVSRAPKTWVLNDFLAELAAKEYAQQPVTQTDLRDLIATLGYTIIATPQQFGAKGDGVTDDARAIEAAHLSLFNAGGGLLIIPPGTYLLGTLSTDPNAYASYVCPRNGVSVRGAGMGVTVFKVKSGENARLSTQNAPNILATQQASPLTNCNFSDFTVDWNGANNLIVNGYAARANASLMSLNGGINVNVQRVQCKETPGNQCVFFPCTSDLGQRNVTIEDCDFLDSGTALAGNYSLDHSSIYCNGTANIYRNNRFRTTGLFVTGTCFEMHGDNGIAVGNIGDSYDRAFWIASNFKAISNNEVSGGHFTNLLYGPGQSGPTWAVNNTKTHGTTFIQRAGATYSATTYFVLGSTVISADYVKFSDCEFIGVSAANCRFMQHQRIVDFLFHGNRVKGFAGFGIVGAGLDAGGGKLGSVVSITNNVFEDVVAAVSFIANAALTVDSFNVSQNKFIRTAVDATAPIALSAASSRGLVIDNDFDPNYTAASLLTGTPNGVKLVRYTEGTWTPVVTGATTAGTYTPVIQQGTYTRRGNKITFIIVLSWNTHTGTGGIQVSLPFNPVVTNAASQLVEVKTENIALTAAKQTGALISSNNLINLYEFQSAGGKGLLAMSAAGILYLSGSYEAAA